MIPKIKTGPHGARLSPAQASWFILTALDQSGITFRLTSGVEGRHSRRSKHYTGEAVDVVAPRVSQINAAAALREALGPDFDVVSEWEPKHIHIEYDPK